VRLSGGLVSLVAMLFLAALGLGAGWLTRPRPAVPPPPRLVLAPVSFEALTGWRQDAHGAALRTFLGSCRRFARWSDERPLGPEGIAGRIGDWRPLCVAAGKVDARDHVAARQFFEAGFTPLEVRHGDDVEGLFTGYYEPLLSGSRQQSARFPVPLHRRPGDLVSADLGRFDAKLKGRRITGRVAKGRLEPYPDRTAIEIGGLGEAAVLLWVDSAVDAFFLHIQGSGRVRLEDGTEVRVGYAGQNGRRYYAIGRELIKRGVLTSKNVSMQSIRGWLEAHPAEGAKVMRLNPSYVFFRELGAEGPIGALGVVLTPGRSIAVDRRRLPLGVPVWLEASAPAADAKAADRPLRRLMVAQDTGGAIRGAVRGDVFWGHGPEAAAVAGRMKHRGRWYLLLPKRVADRFAGG
jgi:membrane-bound lytic murein transglycosylase A